MNRTLHGLLALVAVFLLHAPSASAQVDRATLSGIVRDTGGGVVPGATVTVSNVATNVESHQTTTETGGYQVVNLVPGRYQVEVELTGFKKSSQVITLEVGQRVRLDVELAVGSFSEVVTVAETAQLLNSNDATLGAVIPQMQVSNLPLAIRNWDDLLALVPGVQGDRYTEQGGGTSFGRTGGINVHGARALHHGGDLGFGNSVPSAEVPLEQFPDNIFGDATPGGGCNHTPGYIVPAAFNGFAQNDGCGAPPAAIKSGQHVQAFADCLRATRPALSRR